MTSPEISPDLTPVRVHAITEPGDTVNLKPNTATPPPCPCHDSLDCPDQVTVPVNAVQLARLADLLGEVDEFLRCGNGVAERLADFYAHRGDPHPAFTAVNLIDAASFAADHPRRLVIEAAHDPGDDQ